MKVSLLAIALLLAALPAVHAQENVTITHASGQTTVPKNPGRVLIFDLNTLETYHELGIPVLGGMSNIPDYLPGFKNNADYKAAGSLVKADLAAVQALKPDLIVIGGRMRSVYDSLSAIAPTVIFGTEADDFWSGFEKNVRTIASLHGKEKQAEEKLAALRRKTELVRGKSKEDTGKALFALHVNKRFAPNGPKSRFGFGYDVLGLKPAYTPAPSAGGRSRGSSGQGGQEGGERQPGPSLADINPDYLFVFDRETGIKGTMPDKESLMTDDVKQTNAYKQGKVFLLPGNIWYLGGGGLVSVDRKITDIGRLLYGITF